MFATLTLPQASTIAPAVDRLYQVLTWFGILSFSAVIGAMIYFIVRYHRHRTDPEKTPNIHGHPILEGFIMVGLFFVVMGFFYWGWVDYEKMIAHRPDALEVNVLGRQWLWDFEYLNGRKMTNELVLPRDRPVRLIMSSVDVLHSFFIPAFRVKQDVVPGTYTSLAFTATQNGEHQVFCAEYCGTAHSSMLAKIKVVDAQEYDRWQKEWEWKTQVGLSTDSGSLPPADDKGAAGPPSAQAQASPIERGKKLFTDKGCTACHTVNGQPLVGPTLKGIFGHEIELVDGKKVTVDENYIRESLMDPQKSLVKGFAPVMPTFRGSLSDDEVNSLVAYIKSL